MSRRVTISVTALAICLSASAVALASGSPFSSLSVRSGHADVTDPGQPAKVKVGCGDKSGVSGGFNIGKVNAIHGPVVDGSRAKGSGWQTNANEYAQNSTSDRVTGYANCASKAPNLKAETASTTVQASQSKSVTADCKQGTRAVSGGFKTKYVGNAAGGNIDGVLVSSSYRSGDGSWTTTGSGVSKGSPTKLTAYVYCADIPKLKAASKRTAGKDGRTHPKAVAKCPAGTHAVSGGFRSEVIKQGQFLQSNVPEVSGLKGKRAWKAQAFYFSFSNGTLGWKVYVYCAG